MNQTCIFFLFPSVLLSIHFVLTNFALIFSNNLLPSHLEMSNMKKHLTLCHV